MTFDWPNLAMGAVLGAIFGILGDWQIGARLRAASERQKLKKQYGHVAGNYANFRVKDDGAQEATGGKIKLTLQPDGSFTVKGLHSNGVVEWEGLIRMSMEFKGAGTGSYKYLGSNTFGTQQVTYIPDGRFFHVVGTSTSDINLRPFAHIWKRIDS